MISLMGFLTVAVIILTIMALILLIFGKDDPWRPTTKQGIAPKTRKMKWWVELGGCSQGGKHHWVTIDKGRFCRGNDIGFGIRNSVTMDIVEECQKCKKQVTYTS